jgi:hypothetical protein
MARKIDDDPEVEPPPPEPPMTNLGVVMRSDWHLQGTWPWNAVLFYKVSHNIHLNLFLLLISMNKLHAMLLVNYTLCVC